MMNYARLTTWIKDFAFRWLLPKASITFVVYAMTHFLFGIVKEADISESSQSEFNSLVAVPFGKYFPYVFAALAIVFILSLYASGGAKGPTRKLYWLARLGPKIGKLLNMLMGTLLVPIVILITILRLQHDDANIYAQSTLLVYAYMLIVICAAFDYLSITDQHPRHSITYKISGSLKCSEDDFHHTTAVRLNEVLSHVPWHDGAVSVTQTADRSTTLVIPIYLDFELWMDKEIKSLNKYLKAIEREWSDNNYNISTRPITWIRHPEELPPHKNKSV